MKLRGKWSKIAKNNVEGAGAVPPIHSGDGVALERQRLHAIDDGAPKADEPEEMGAPERPDRVFLADLKWAPNWSQQRIPSTNQHPISTGTKQRIAHGACGVGRGCQMREKW